MIYLGCPYNHEDAKVRKKRFDAVTYVAGCLINEGKVVFSPITQNHPIANIMDLPKGWDYWEKFDSKFLTMCDELHVLMLDGWEKSVGLKGEIELADKLGKLIVYLDPKDYV